MTNSVTGAGRADIDAVLAEMRQVARHAQAQPIVPPTVNELSASPQQSSESFSVMFRQALSQVNSLQRASGEQASQVVRGESDDLVGAMVAAQKSRVAFEALTQVRNRMVSAYQEIMNMPI